MRNRLKIHKTYIIIGTILICFSPLAAWLTFSSSILCAPVAYNEDIISVPNVTCLTNMTWLTLGVLLILALIGMALLIFGLKKSKEN